MVSSKPESAAVSRKSNNCGKTKSSKTAAVEIRRERSRETKDLKMFVKSLLYKQALSVAVQFEDS
jgi:hypothetical protein